MTTATSTQRPRPAYAAARSLVLLVCAVGCVAARSEPLQVIAVDPAVTPIAHAAEVLLTFNQPLEPQRVALAPGGARLAAQILLPAAVASAAFGPQSLLAVTTEGSAIRVHTADNQAIADTLLPPGTVDSSSAIAFDDTHVLIVSPTGKAFAGDTSSGRWVTSQLSWEPSETLRGAALGAGIGVVATTHTLLSFTTSGDADNGLHRIRFNSEIRAVAVAPPLAVVAFDRAIDVFLVDDDGELSRQATFATQFPVADLALDDQYVAAALAESGVMLLDIAEPRAPIWLSRYSNIGSIARIQLKEDRLLAASSEGRYFAFDIANAATPVVDQTFYGPRVALAMAQTSDTAWIVDKDQLELWDVSASAPRLSNADLDAGQGVNYGGQRKGFFDHESKRLFVADWFSGIHIYDVATADRPRLLSTFHTPGSPKGVVVRDNMAFIADDDHGLQIVDVSDPRNPTLVTNMPLKGLAYTPWLEGNWLYVASHHGGFQIVDVADPSQPRLTGEYDTPGKAWSLAKKDIVLMVADSEGGLIGFDISNPAQPNPVWEFNPGGHAEDVLVDGDFAYAAFFDGTVYTLNVADPLQPEILGQAKTPGNARGLAKLDADLYVADWMAGVVKLDVSDPQSPQMRDWADTDGASWGVILGDKQIFAFDWWGGLVVLEDDEHRGLVSSGKYNQFGKVHDVAVLDSYLVSAEGEYGLQVYDIKNELNPTWSGGLELEAAARLITVAGKHAFVAIGNDQIAEVDLSNPFAPRTVGLIKADAAISDLKSDGNFIGYQAGDATLCVVKAEAGGLPKCEQLEGGVADFDISEGFVTAASGTRVWRWRATDFPVTVDATFAVDARPQFLRINSGGIWLVGEDGRLGVFDDASKAYTPGDSPLPIGAANDMVVEGSRAVFATKEGVQTLEIATDAQTTDTHYDAGRGINRLAASNGVIYGASAGSIFAVRPIDAVAWSVTNSNQLRIDVPASLPEGGYDVVVDTGDNKLRLDNIIRRQLKGFAKPKLSTEQFNQLLQEQRGTAKQLAP